MMVYKLRFLLLCILFALFACDGNSDGQTNLFADSGGSTGNANSLNGGLGGKLVTAYTDFAPKLFNLSTGVYGPMGLFNMPETMAERGAPVYRSLSSLSLNRTAPESGFVQTFIECYKDGMIYHKSCVVVLAADGSARKMVTLEGELNYEVKLSPDGNFVAMNEFFEVSGPTNSFLQIRNVSDFALTHEIKLRSSNNSDGKAVVEWGASGELYYTNSTDEQAIIYITEPYTLESAGSITLPDQYTGEIESLDISPDGKKMLIGYDPAALNAVPTGSVFLLDLVTFDLTTPAIDHQDSGVRPLGDDVAGYVHSPAWSPDGRWILVRHSWNAEPGGYYDPSTATTEPYTDSSVRPSQPAPSGRAVRRMFAVPADSEYIELGDTAEQISSEAILLFNIPVGSDWLSDEWLGGNVLWLD